MQYDRSTMFQWRGRKYQAHHVTDNTHMGEDFLTVRDDGGFWATFAPEKRDVVELAGLPDPWDYALPQDWYDEHRQEIADHGGWAVWHYPAGNLFGVPVFADELEQRAKQTAASEIAAQTCAAQETSPQNGSTENKPAIIIDNPFPEE